MILYKMHVKVVEDDDLDYHFFFPEVGADGHYYNSDDAISNIKEIDEHKEKFIQYVKNKQIKGDVWQT